MFDFLKKKITGFVDKLTKKEEEKAEEKPPEKKPKEKPEKKIEKPPPKPVKEKPKPVEVPKPVEKKAPPKEKPKPPVEKVIEKKPVVKEKPKEVKPVEKVVKPPPKPEPQIKVEEKKPEPVPKPEKVEEKAVPEEVEEPEIKIEEKPVPEEAPPEPEEEIEEPEPKAEEKPKERIKLGAVAKLKGLITREVEISEGDVKELLENLELELLESDVELSVAEAIREEMTEKLIGAKVKKDAIHSFVSDSIRETLIQMISNEKAFDIVEKVKESEKPVKIMFLGINGAGKTTTIAKVAKLLMDNNYKIVFAAADTFRAAAIEQMEVHAKKLDVKMIKRDYGSDPTSVAYDAMNYAKARGIDAVLIDTAGRQDTNISLINEIKKMNRVIQPEIKIYIGESIAGNAIIEQVRTFNREIGIDGVILTKLDCDPKGGTMLSINRTTDVPIIYVGTGQAYGDLEAFEPARIVDRIVE